MSRPDLTGLDRPELARLWAAGRQRLERNSLEPGSSPLVLRDLTPAERDAVAGLLGERPVPPPRPVRIDPARLDLVLRGGRVAAGLVDVVVALGGPLRDRREERSRREADARSLWATGGAHPAVGLHPELAGWLEALRTTGLVTRLAGDDPVALLVEALDVLAELPVDPPEPLAALAARLLGDAHALDADRAVATLVVRGLSHLERRPPPTGADERRALLAAWGVTVDELSARVLVLGLAHPAVADTDEPTWLTLRGLRRAAVSCWGPEPVRVCENPTVVAAAADQVAGRSGALVCTNGVPDASFHELARQAAAAGRPLAVRADFDAAGLRIVTSILARTPGVPWRFDAETYRQVAGRGLAALAGPLPGTPWSPQLRHEMARTGRAVHEEAMLDLLLEDLAGLRPA